MKINRTACLSILLVALSANVATAQNAETYKESAAERDACTSDVYRLCKRYIPSRSAITRCLERSTELSPVCSGVINGARGATAEASPRRDPRD